MIENNFKGNLKILIEVETGKLYLIGHQLNSVT
jgi:hypothetical protein